MSRRLTDQALEELRDAYTDGQTTTQLAETYRLTERHVRRLVADLEPPAPTFTVGPNETVETAVTRFLQDIEQDPQGDVIAATARTLARRLDSADSRAAPALARALIATLDDIRRSDTDNDAIADLRRRRDARRLLDQATR